jgi:glutamate/tyrosine decarboxylase-like PLP-dependent enzyme
MDVKKLEQQIVNDKTQGYLPFIIIGNSGTVSTGTIDNLDEISIISKSHGIWFHIDGAYGAPAAGLEELKASFKGLSEADSIAIDPHKWFYSPIEAGCILVKHKGDLQNTFSYNPEYYNFDGESIDNPTNFHEYGLQNSRGFKALKVWMSLRQVGKTGFANLIRNDILLAQRLFLLIDQNEYLQAISRNLSITTFRFIPKNLEAPNDEHYLNQLNEKLLNILQESGEVYLSNAIINDKYCLRVCIVNFRTEYSDLEALVNIVFQKGQKLHESALINQDNYYEIQKN